MNGKKLIPAIAALCAAALFGGCNNKQKAVNEYDTLNAMLDLDYSQIVLTVTETFGEDAVLTGEYTMQFTDDGIAVAYSVERFSELSLDAAVPAKTALAGEATITGGKVTYVQGDEVNLDAVAAGVGLNFKEDYFANADLTDVYLRADVKKPSAFLGAAVVCTDMKVFATFTAVLRDVKITYTAEDGSLVEYDYAFKK